MLIQQSAVLAAGIIDIFLAFLVISRNPRALIHRIFFLLAMSYAIWSFSLFLYQYPLIFSSLFWIRATYVLVVAFISLVLTFSFIFPIPVPKTVFKVGVVLGIIYIAFSLWMLFFTPWFVQDVRVVPGKGLQTILGPGYLWWNIFSWFPLVTAALNIVFKTHKVDRKQRVQMNYFWAAFTIFGIAVCIPDAVIPLIWHDTRYFYISPVSNFIFSGTVAYIILKHRFLDVRRLAIGLLSRLVITVGLGIVYTVIAYAIAKYFFPQLLSIQYILITITCALVFRTLVFSQEQRLKRRIERLFNKGIYNREDVVQQVSEITVQTLSLSELAQSLSRYLSTVFNTNNASIIVRSKEKTNIFTIYSLEPTRVVVHKSKEMEKMIEETASKFFVTDELPDGNPVKKFFKDRNVTFTSPLFVRGEQVGYLSMYEKKNDEIYTTYDYKTIEIISPHVAVALQNVLHIEEIKQFNARLKKEVTRATADLRTANQELHELDRLKDEFISMASHELRTPTTVIKSFLWILLHKDRQLSPDTKKRLARIYQLSTHMGNLIKDMLDVSMIESGKLHMSPESFDLSELVKETVEELQTAHGAKREITFADKGKHTVYADRDKIHQVIGNLLTNAIKYTKENGKVAVSIIDDTTKVAVTVADNGIGIKKEDLKKLFTKFGKLHSIHSQEGQIPGSGLGLYISKRIIDLSSGTLSVDSAVGKGSTFTFTLPKDQKNGSVVKRD